MARTAVLVATCLLAGAASAQERPRELRARVDLREGVVQLRWEREARAAHGATPEVELQLRSLLGATIVVAAHPAGGALMVERIVEPRPSCVTGIVLHSDGSRIVHFGSGAYSLWAGTLTEALGRLGTGREVELEVMITRAYPGDFVQGRAALIGIRATRGREQVWIRDARGSEVLIESANGPRRWVPAAGVAVGRSEGLERRRVRGRVVWLGPFSQAVLRVGIVDHRLETTYSGPMNPDFWEGREVEVEGVVVQPAAKPGPLPRLLVERFISPSEENHWQPYRGTVGPGPVLIRRDGTTVPLRPVGPLTPSLLVLQDKYAPKRRLITLLGTLVGQQVVINGDLMRDANGKDTELLVRWVRGFSRTEQRQQEHHIIDYVDGKVRSHRTKDGEWIPLADLEVGWRSVTSALEGR